MVPLSFISSPSSSVIVSTGILFFAEVLRINTKISPHLFLHSLQFHCSHSANVDRIKLKMCLASVHNFTHLFQILRHPHIARANNTQLHNALSWSWHPLQLQNERDCGSPESRHYTQTWVGVIWQIMTSSVKTLLYHDHDLITIPIICHWIPVCRPYSLANEFEWNTQNPNKTQLLAVRILTPKWTLYSAHWCDKLRVNVKRQDSTWRAWDVALFISMLLVYSYYFGTRRRQWMLFRPPFMAMGERLVENKISCRIKLISLFFYRFI